jgi:malonyl-CoA decarboxylase
MINEIIPQRSFLSDILRRVTWAGLGQAGRGRAEQGLPEQCHDLLSDPSEASRLVRAQRILDLLEDQTPQALRDFFAALAADFGADDAALQDAITAWSPGDTVAARRIHFAAEPASQELIRALNSVPGATARLVRLREALLTHVKADAGLAGLDRDFQHLFASWFNRGFLEIRRIDWSTPANILEKIIAYEAVHEITGWDDLRQRVGDPDRRLFAFFHPAMPSEPLIFVEVALVRDIPGAISPILNVDRDRMAANEATTAVFYSISNCQNGLRGISFGNFLIKQVVAELQRELPQLATFVTLSPVPGLRRWAERAAQSDDPVLPEDLREPLKAAIAADLALDRDLAQRLAAIYLTGARHPKGRLVDPVAHFHLGNGAMLHRIHADADPSARGVKNAWGVMVNYLYVAPKIETNHEAYATKHQVIAASEVKALAGLR